VRNIFPPPTSLKQLEDVLQEEWYKIPLETVQNLYESIARRTAAVLKSKGGPTTYCDGLLKALSYGTTKTRC
jgi:hypothetical protein